MTKQNNEQILNQLQELVIKLDEARNKMFFIHEVTNDLETYAVKFDKREKDSAQWLAYEYSRICVPFMSLAFSVDNDLTETESKLENIINSLRGADDIQPK